MFCASCRTVVASDKERYFGKLEDGEAEGPCPSLKVGCLVLALSPGIKVTLWLCPEIDTRHVKAMFMVTKPVSV